jgi:initiation factor 1A
MLGNGRLEAMCFDGEKRLAHIRGKLRKKVWINQGDIILLSLRDYQDEKGDVILKYTADEARNLKAYGELPENAKINETDTYGLSISQSFAMLLFVCSVTKAVIAKLFVWLDFVAFVFLPVDNTIMMRISIDYLTMNIH